MAKKMNASPRVRGHFERVSMNECHYPKALHEPYEVTASEQYVENGRILKKAVNKTVDPTKQNAGLSVSDFYLENIIAVGAEGSLRDVKLSAGNFDVADNVDAQIGAIDASIQANVEPQNNEGE